MKIIYKGTTKDRVDKFLVSETGLSRTKAQALIKAEQVSVNGKIPSVHQFLQTGDAIVITQQKKTAVKKTAGIKPNPKVPFKIIAETKDYLIVDKPAGIIVHPNEQGNDDTLINGLVAKYPELKKIGENALRPAIVHRLDKEVSGLLIVPRNQKAFLYIKNLLKTRQVKKTYTAMVHGAIERPAGSIDLRIGRSRKLGKMAAYPSTAEMAKEAVTHYYVEKNYNFLTLLKVVIETGRTHQIRVHFNAINHPVVGDRLYTQRFLKRKKLELDRLFLHSAELEFIDLDGKKVHYKSPLPKELKDFLKNL